MRRISKQITELDYRVHYYIMYQTEIFLCYKISITSESHLPRNWRSERFKCKFKFNKEKKSISKITQVKSYWDAIEVYAIHWKQWIKKISELTSVSYSNTSKQIHSSRKEIKEKGSMSREDGLIIKSMKRI